MLAVWFSTVCCWCAVMFLPCHCWCLHFSCCQCSHLLFLLFIPFLFGWVHIVWCCWWQEKMTCCFLGTRCNHSKPKEKCCCWSPYISFDDNGDLWVRKETNWKIVAARWNGIMSQHHFCVCDGMLLNPQVNRQQGKSFAWRSTLFMKVFKTTIIKDSSRSIKLGSSDFCSNFGKLIDDHFWWWEKYCDGSEDWNTFFCWCHDVRKADHQEIKKKGISTPYCDQVIDFCRVVKWCVV